MVIRVTVARTIFGPLGGTSRLKLAETTKEKGQMKTMMSSPVNISTQTLKRMAVQHRK